MKMLISMNYTQDGSRTITAIYSYPFTPADEQDLIQWLGENNDEVYACDFNQNYTPLIDELVLKNCRIV